jgi:hypothetical protein
MPIFDPFGSSSNLIGVVADYFFKDPFSPVLTSYGVYRGLTEVSTNSLEDARQKQVVGRPKEERKNICNNAG